PTPPAHPPTRETPHPLPPPTTQPSPPRTPLQPVAHGAPLRQLDALDAVERGERREPGHLDRPYDVARRHLIQAEARHFEAVERERVGVPQQHLHLHAAVDYPYGPARGRGSLDERLQLRRE